MKLLAYIINLLCSCLLLFLSFSFGSCKKMVAVSTPVSQLASPAVFADSATAVAALTGLYSEIMRPNNNLLDGGTTLYTALSADELAYNGTAADQLELYQNNLSSTNSILGANLWRSGYITLYHANALLEGLGASAALSGSLKNQLAGEALVIRAFTYIYLLGLFGEVPLLTTTDFRTNAAMPRTPADKVWAQVIVDLRSAKARLTPAYPAAGRSRPNRWTAAALLARAFLYTGNWAAADSAATEVIEAGLYSLVPNLNNVFLAGSPEAVWQLLPVNPSFNTWEGQNLLASSTTVKPTYTLTATLLNAFETDDARKAAWTKFNTVGGTPWYYPSKYKVRSGSTITETYTVLRLAEIYLVRAEARVHLGNLQGAAVDLNRVRSRAGLPGTAATGSESLLQAIAHERQVELMVEWGHRWFDLKRTAAADTVLAAKPGWQPTDALYPIPFSEIQLNSSLTQNKGYQ